IAAKAHAISGAGSAKWLLAIASSTQRAYITGTRSYNTEASGPEGAALHTSEFLDLPTILILAVAVIIFFRLRSVLGRRTGAERPRLDPYAAPDAAPPREREGNVITL